MVCAFNIHNAWFSYKLTRAYTQHKEVSMGMGKRELLFGGVAGPWPAIYPDLLTD